jgi:two-component system sensor histidine kinase BaeS
MRMRLMLSFALIVVVSVAAVVLIVRQGAAVEVRAFMFRGGASGTSGLVTSLEEYYAAHQTWQGVESLFTSMPGRHGGAGGGPGGPGGQGPGAMMNQRLRLADASGNLVYDTANPGATGSLSQDQIASAIALESGGKTVGYLLPEGATAFTTGEERALVSRLSQAAITAGLIGAGLSLVLALLLAYRLVRPVRALTTAARKLAAGDLSQRVTVAGDDELAVLGHTFNQMAESLQQAEATRRAMTADIAHELRNPLAVQRANLEALQDGIYPSTPENLTPILEQNQLLTRLVEDLRTLALADSGELKLEQHPTDLPRLVRRVVDRFTTQANANQIHLEVISSPVMPPLLLDAGRVEQIISNLISNALRHTPPGGRIQVTLNLQPSSQQPDSVLVSVHDSGEGIPAEALPHIFERFYRADRSRSRSQGGTGLGLAIARRLAEAHEGRLTAANHPDGGAVFTLHLPFRVDQHSPSAREKML